MDGLFKKENMGQNVLAVLFVIYLIMGYKTPAPVANMIDTMWGKIIVITIALLLFAYANPVLGVLGIFVAFDLIKRSTISTGNYALSKYLPTEKKKMTELTAYNQFPYTLEQEVVKNMTTQKFNTEYVKASFAPTLDDTHEASSLSA